MAGKLPRRTITGGARKTPTKGTASKPFTGKGSSGTGLGYHGNPGKATKPAKGLGYHGKPPKGLKPPSSKMPRRPVTSPGGHPPMVIPHSKPAAHKAGSKRHPGK